MAFKKPKLSFNKPKPSVNPGVKEPSVKPGVKVKQGMKGDGKTPKPATEETRMSFNRPDTKGNTLNKEHPSLVDETKG